MYWVGLGSNLLVRDGGIRGVVIATPGAFTRIERAPQTRIYCEASVPCARIARCCVQLGARRRAISSAAFPGTLGGALAMNAGAFGDETWRHVVAVETIDRRGQRRTRAARPRFRSATAIGRVELAPAAPMRPSEWFLSAELQFEPRGAVRARRQRAAR